MSLKRHVFGECRGKIRASGQLYIAAIMRELPHRAALFRCKRHHCRPGKGRVADAVQLVLLNARQHADLHRAFRIDIASEAACKIQTVNIGAFHSLCREQNVYPCRDSGLCKLKIAHILRSEINLARQVKNAVAVFVA